MGPPVAAALSERVGSDSDLGCEWGPSAAGVDNKGARRGRRWRWELEALGGWHPEATEHNIHIAQRLHEHLARLAKRGQQTVLKTRLAQGAKRRYPSRLLSHYVAVARR